MTRSALTVLHEEIEARCTSTNAAHTDWPCKLGCDLCCRQLADEPRLTRAEWALLEVGLAALDPTVRAEVEARVSALAAQLASPERPRHVTCPLLDLERAACLVYAQRPITCRTHGYYADRDRVLGCDDIAALAEARPEVVWGHAATVERALARLDPEPPRGLTAWLLGEPEHD